MSFNVDQINVKNIVPSPVTVNTDWATDKASLDDLFGAFMIYIKYDNGVGATITATLQMSPTGEDSDWANVADTDVVITDSSGTVSYDVSGSGMQWVRIKLTVAAGSIDVTSGDFRGTQAH